MKRTNSKKVFAALAISAFFTTAATQLLTGSAMENSADIKIGTAYLEAGSDINIAADAIYGDGQYEMIWDVSDASAINEAAAIRLVIRNEDPYPLGVKDELTLSVDEVWVDGVKLDEALHGEPAYAVAADYIYSLDEIVQIQYLLRGASFNDLDIEINESIKVVFTLSNLTDPEEYPAGSEPTEPTTATETQTVEQTVSESDTKAEPTGKSDQSSSAPQTGDAGIAGVLTILAASGITAYGFKKEK